MFAVKKGLHIDHFTSKKIYSDNTIRTYLSQVNRFIDFVIQGYNCKSLHHIIDYLDEYIALFDSPWTQSTAACAVCKMLGLHYARPNSTAKKKARADIILYNLKDRNSKDVKKNRGKIENYSEIERVNTFIGARAREFKVINSKDLFYDEKGNAYVMIYNGKGGKVRRARIIDNDPETIAFIENLDKPCNPPKGTRFQLTRQEAAYKLYLRLQEYYGEGDPNKKVIIPGSEKPVSEIYSCRGDHKGTKFNRSVLLRVSRDLGHNRPNVVVQSYLLPYMDSHGIRNPR